MRLVVIAANRLHRILHSKKSQIRCDTHASRWKPGDYRFECGCPLTLSQLESVILQEGVPYAIDTASAIRGSKRIRNSFGGKNIVGTKRDKGVIRKGEIASIDEAGVRGSIMGSGDRIKFRTINGIMFGVFVDRFPFEWTVDFYFLCFGVSIGFGKAYDE